MTQSCVLESKVLGLEITWVYCEGLVLGLESLVQCLDLNLKIWARSLGLDSFNNKTKANFWFGYVCYWYFITQVFAQYVSSLSYLLTVLHKVSFYYRWNTVSSWYSLFTIAVEILNRRSWDLALQTWLQSRGLNLETKLPWSRCFVRLIMVWCDMVYVNYITQSQKSLMSVTRLLWCTRR